VAEGVGAGSDVGAGAGGCARGGEGGAEGVLGRKFGARLGIEPFDLVHTSITRTYPSVLSLFSSIRGRDAGSVLLIDPKGSYIIYLLDATEDTM
jgi:hypothetical protein